MLPPAPPRICPACGAPQPPNAQICVTCARPLAQMPAARRPFPQPYRWTLRVMGALLALLTGTLLTASLMAARGTWSPEISYALSFVWLIFSITYVVFWLQIHTNRRRAAEFLASDRPLVRWVYTEEEWLAIREAAWEHARTDWALPLGCLPVLFGMSGLLMGLLVGLEDGSSEAVVGALVGGTLGALAGALFGAMAVAVNAVAARRAYAQAIPAEVALGQAEICYNGHYLRDGVWARIRRVAVTAGPPPRLVVETRAPRYRIERGFVGVIDVPPRMIPALTDVVPQMRGATPWTDDLLES
ncbi:MAG: zinc ribbon domain-containing protein [Chloroflexales bacterium]